LLQIAGVCYLVNSFSLVAAPDFASLIFPTILLPAFIGESALALWLLKGVDEHRWDAKVRGAPDFGAGIRSGVAP